MKTLSIIFGLIGIISFIYLGVWYGYSYPKDYEYALNLADDASLPADKADYLKEYRDKVWQISGEPRWFFKKPDLNLDKQLNILSGLITRFEDIAKISPSEMAYQQGMEQLTGQEMDNQLDRISGIFRSAKVRENPIEAVFMWFGWLIFGALSTLFGIYAYHKGRG